MRRVIGFLIYGVNALAVVVYFAGGKDDLGTWAVLHYLWLGAMGILLTSWIAAGPDRDCPSCGRPWERGLTVCDSCGYYVPGPRVAPAAPPATAPHRTATPAPPVAPRPPVPPPPPPGARP